MCIASSFPAPFPFSKGKGAGNEEETFQEEQQKAKFEVRQIIAVETLSRPRPRPKTDMVKKSCSYKSITRWNALENQMRSIQDVDAFKKSLKCIFKPRML